jgi:uncharacterized RDD family membrane protein YckC
MAVFDGRRLERLEAGDALGDISPPFVLEGEPAVVESRLDGTRLVRWTGGGWQKDRSLSGVDSVCCIQVIAVGDEVTVFRSKGESLYARGLYDAERPWVVVASRPDDWRAFIRNGRPAVAVANSTEGLRILEPEGGRWRVIQTMDDGRRLSREVTVFEREPGGRLTVLSSGFPGSITVRQWDHTRLVGEQRFGRSSPFPRKMMAVMWLPHLGAPILSLILAVILSWLMRVHRVGVYRYEATEVAHASLTRRAISQLVDAVLMAAPTLFLFARFVEAFTDPEQMFFQPGGPLRFFAFVAAGFAWTLAAFLLFSVTEGLWGATPGKWLTGIRAIGTDLRPCGIGRALIRNLLKMVDGFFNFLIGILMVAYTPDWQRLGDLAARTIVIRAPAGGLRELRG